MQMRIAALALILGSSLLTVLPVSAQQRDVMLVLDASNSMWGQIDGKNKIVIAREVVRDVLGNIPADIRLGVLAYGHRSEGDCSDIETVIPVGPVDRDRYMAVIDAIKPRGKTPLTEAVRQAAEALRYTDVPSTVILVSDGVETCDADPCTLASELEAAGADFTVHVVGFDVSAEDAASFSCLADRTGGRFFQASNASELTEALGTAVQDVAAAEPPAPAQAPGQAREGPNLKLSAVPAEGMEPMTSGPYWVIYEADADANGNRKEVKRSGNPIALIDVPSGRYWVEASYKATRVGREIEVPAEGKAEEVFVLGAGRLTAVALPADGAAPYDEAYWVLYSAAKDLNGKREEIARDGSADADFFVPAGTYWLEGQHKTAKGGVDVTVEAGKLTEAALVLGAGVLAVTAVAIEGEDPLDQMTFIVYEAAADLSGNRKEVTRSARELSEFGLPSGKYFVVARSGEAEASSEIEVNANERTELQFILNVGAVKFATSVDGLTQEIPAVPFRYEIVSGSADLSGKRKAVTNSARPEPVFRLPAGRYRVIARLGSQNVSAETDIEITAGQLTEMTIAQQAAFVTFTVDGTPDGRMRWEILDQSGKSVGAAVRPELRLVLAPGDYEANLIVDDKKTGERVRVKSGDVRTVAIAPPQ